MCYLWMQTRRASDVCVLSMQFQLLRATYLVVFGLEQSEALHLAVLLGVLLVEALQRQAQVSCYPPRLLICYPHLPIACAALAALRAGEALVGYQGSECCQPWVRLLLLLLLLVFLLLRNVALLLLLLLLLAPAACPAPALYSSCR
jgi:hypothetical protein